MIIYSSYLEKIGKSTLEGIYDIEDYAGVPIIPFHKYVYNLNENKTYRIDFKDRVMFWENGEVVDLPKEYQE